MEHFNSDVRDEVLKQLAFGDSQRSDRELREEYVARGETEDNINRFEV